MNHLLEVARSIQEYTRSQFPLRETVNPLPNADRPAIVIGERVLVCPDTIPGSGNRYLLLGDVFLDGYVAKDRAEIYGEALEVFTYAKIAVVEAVYLYISLRSDEEGAGIHAVPDDHGPNMHWTRHEVICDAGWLGLLVPKEDFIDGNERVRKQYGLKAARKNELLVNIMARGKSRGL